MVEFKKYHPIVNFIYFVLVIGFSCFFMHPLCLLISLGCGFLYSVMLKGKKAFRANFMYMIPVFFITALINPLFNHKGITVLCYLPSGNPLTLESIIYGLFTATMLVGVMCHFYCYTEIMTSDKFMYLFGKIIPSMSLIISMTLRFVPRFLAQFKVVLNAQKCMGRDVSGGSLIKRIKNALNILSIMTTWALENAVDTADSMKARGYGMRGRTAFSIYNFDKRDAKALIYILLFGAYTFAGYLAGGMYFSYFPSVKQASFTLFDTSVYVAYFMLCICPVVIEFREVIKWKALRSKM